VIEAVFFSSSYWPALQATWLLQQGCFGFLASILKEKHEAKRLKILRLGTNIWTSFVRSYHQYNLQQRTNITTNNAQLQLTTTLDWELIQPTTNNRQSTTTLYWSYIQLTTLDLSSIQPTAKNWHYIQQLTTTLDWWSIQPITNNRQPAITLN